MNRVVITGFGIYSCIGQNADEVRDSLYKGKSGIGFEQVRKDMGFRSALTGILPVPNLKDKLHRRFRNSMPEEAEYAFLATDEALRMAKIDDAFLDNNIIGILYGNDSTAKATIEGVDVMREIATLREGLKDTVAALAEELDLEKKLLNKKSII